MSNQIIFGLAPREIPSHSVFTQNYLWGHRYTFTITSPFQTHNYLFISVRSLWTPLVLTPLSSQPEILGPLHLDKPTALGSPIQIEGSCGVLPYQIVCQRVKDPLPGPNPLIFNPLTLKLRLKNPKKFFFVS
jgi:hypothetical protein